MKFLQRVRHNTANLYNVHIACLCAIAFTFPFSIKLNTYFIIADIFVCLFQFKIINGFKTSSKKTYVILLWLFYAAHIISAVLSHNKHEGFAIVERKASFFILPILLFSYNIVATDIRKISLSFVIGVLLAFIICLYNATYRYFFNHCTAEVFFYQTFTYVLSINAVYLAAYCLIAFHIVLYYAKTFKKYIVIILSICFVIFCVLLSSKMMLVCLLLGTCIYFFKKVKFAKAFVLSGVAVVSLFLAVAMLPSVQQRITNEINLNSSVLNQKQYTYDTPFTGTSLRIVFWKLSFELLNEKHTWLQGVTIGDFQNLLNEKYKQKGIYTGNPQLKDTGYLGYGPHNQYIEILLSTGIVGLVLFLSLLSNYCFYASSTKNYLAIQIIIIFLLFFCSESVLSVNKGVVPFVFFTLLFYLQDKSLTSSS